MVGKKKCERCEVLPEIPRGQAYNVVFIAKADALLTKLRHLLEETLGLVPGDDEDYLLYSRCDVEKIFEALISAGLSSHEKEDVEVALIAPEEALTPKIFKKFKKLSYYLELFANWEFIEMLKEARLTVHFHPIIDVEKRDIFGYESLIRGVKRDGSLVPPKTLFEVAKMTDMVFYLDRASREMSIKTAAIKNIKDKKIFVNFIPTAIYDPKFCLATTISWAYKMEYDPSNLIFEVAESYKVHDLRHLKQILDYYRSNGFKVALDDVGAGFSNLESLVILKPDFLKIDMEIVRNVHQDPVKQSVCRALVGIAKDNGMDILAEGVETKDEFLFLREQGISFLQGFYFAKPSPEPIREIEFLPL